MKYEIIAFCGIAAIKITQFIGNPYLMLGVSSVCLAYIVWDLIYLFKYEL